MAIIYSYPLDANPTTSDLLLGSSNIDGKPTKTFTIGSIAALANAAGGTGTVTSVSTANSTFIDVTGGIITNAGTITADLSATGTPSNLTFLRGDNTWAAATSTGSPNIDVLDEGVSITAQADSFNFTGSGVTATASGNDVTVNIPGAASAVTSMIGGTGITVSAATGNVTVTNSGVTSLVAGTNITLTPSTGVGNVTINATNNAGTVQSVIAGDGLNLESSAGTEISTPTLGIEKNGSNNYIIVQSSAATPTVNDFIAFNQNSSSNVKTSTFATIPTAALPLVQSYIDTGDADTIKNDTDTYTTTAKVDNVVTLTSTEYAGITPDVNTFYIIAAASTAYTVTLTPVTNSIVSPDGTGTGTGYTITGSVVNDTVTGIAGEPYSFTTTVTPAAGYYFSTPVSGNVVSGTIASTTNVSQTLNGTVTTVPTPSVVATLLVVTNIQGGPADGSGFTLGGSLTNATQTGIAPLTVNTFATTCAASTGYTFSSGPTIVNASGTINGSQTVVTTITGTLQLT